MLATRRLVVSRARWWVDAAPGDVASVRFRTACGRRDISRLCIALVACPSLPSIVTQLSCHPALPFVRRAAMFRGGLPQLTDTSVLFDASRRHMLGTVTTGSVMVRDAV